MLRSQCNRYHKENYRTKSKHSNPTESKEELAKKTEWYEDQLQTMLVENQKVTEAIKKLVEKEISQAQKIRDLEKALKLAMAEQQAQKCEKEDHLLQSLTHENMQLKRKL
jgi:hypothetical protein